MQSVYLNVCYFSLWKQKRQFENCVTHGRNQNIMLLNNKPNLFKTITDRSMVLVLTSIEAWFQI